MSTITNHYNVAVQSRFYAFLQEDCESTEPQILIATAEKKREVLKENKSKAKKEKRAKQIADIKQEIVIEELKHVYEPIEIKHIEEEKVIETTDNVLEEKSVEQKSERQFERRGRGGQRRGGHEGSFRNEEKIHDDDASVKTSRDQFQRPIGNNRGRPYRRERMDEKEDSFIKVGYFEEQSQGGQRGGVERRRPFTRGTRLSRGSDRMVKDDNTSRVETNDNVDTFEESGDRPPTRGGRPRYPRYNRGGYSRFNRPDSDATADVEHNTIGHFDDMVGSCDNGGGGRMRGGGRGLRRGGRGGRGDYRHERTHEFEGNGKEESGSCVPEESGGETNVDCWGSVKDEINLDKLTEDDPGCGDGVEVSGGAKNVSADWGEIEDDGGDVKVDPHKVTMTLDEWKALKEKTVREMMDQKEEMRKANDGRDVFSGMSQYRKGRCVSEEEAGEEAPVQEAGHGRQKQAMIVAVRFSRSGGDMAGVAADVSGERRTFVGSRGRGLPGQDYRGGGRGGDGVRGYGRAGRGLRGPANVGGRRRRDDELEEGPVDVSINLGNEEEFPQLS